MVTVLARAAAHVNPKYVYGDETFLCPQSGQSFQSFLTDYLKGTVDGPEEAKAEVMAECMLEMANFRNKRGWFGSDLALRIAKNKVNLILDYCRGIRSSKACWYIRTETFD